MTTSPYRQVPIPLTGRRRDYAALKPNTFCRSGRNQWALKGIRACGCPVMECVSDRTRVEPTFAQIESEVCRRNCVGRPVTDAPGAGRVAG